MEIPPEKHANHQTMTEVAEVIRDQVISKLKRSEADEFAVADALASCCTGALAKSGINAVVIALDSTLVELALSAKGQPKPNEEEIAKILAICFKDRVNLATACIATKAP